MTPAERRLNASSAAHFSWFNTEDRTARTRPARAAFEAKFLDQSGGDPVRAAHLKKAYFASLAYKSAAARRKSRELIETAREAEAQLAEAGGDLG